MQHPHAWLEETSDSCPGGAKHWQTAPTIEVIEHILSRFHDVHRQQLPQLIHLAKRVELVHGGDALCPAGLTGLLEELQCELVAHMRKEEEILFPMIARGMNATARAPINLMRSDHESHSDLLQQIRRLSHHYRLPENACTTWRNLYIGLAEFETDLQQHIEIENNLLFARINAIPKEK